MKQTKIWVMGCLFLSMITMTAVQSQDNNESLNKELKAIFNSSSEGLSGIYSNDTYTNDLYTQEGPPPAPGGTSDGTAPLDAPIDGGISLLLAAGVVVGARRIRREVNKSKGKEKSPAK